MKTLLSKTIAAVSVVLLLGGCTVISKEAMQQVDEKITLKMVQEHPENYIGKKVLWGGTIISTENKENASEMEVLESELAYDKSPRDGASEGRFIVEAKKFLDPSVYKTEKRVTVAGTVKGTETRKIGKMDYSYPVVVPFEMRLFDKPLPQTTSPYDVYNYPYPYGPMGPYSPWYPSPWPAYPYGPYPYGPYPYRPWPY